jgi:hypothetical protein
MLLPMRTVAGGQHIIESLIIEEYMDKILQNQVQCHVVNG